jgi:ABC-type lipoprotein export system ATPase subunit
MSLLQRVQYIQPQYLASQYSCNSNILYFQKLVYKKVQTYFVFTVGESGAGESTTMPIGDLKDFPSESGGRWLETLIAKSLSVDNMFLFDK